MNKYMIYYEEQEEIPKKSKRKPKWFDKSEIVEAETMAAAKELFLLQFPNTTARQYKNIFLKRG